MMDVWISFYGCDLWVFLQQKLNDFGSKWLRVSLQIWSKPSVMWHQTVFQLGRVNKKLNATLLQSLSSSVMDVYSYHECLVSLFLIQMACLGGQGDTQLCDLIQVPRWSLTLFVWPKAIIWDFPNFLGERASLAFLHLPLKNSLTLPMFVLMFCFFYTWKVSRLFIPGLRSLGRQ